MKKIFLLPALLFMFLFLCSCSETGINEENNTVTAIAIYSGDENWDYNFIVASGKNESEKDSGENSNFNIYRINASDFNSGIEKFEERFGTVNLGHLCSFFIDTKYLQKKIKTDITLIKERISVSPLVNFCVTNSKDLKVLSIIGKNYDGNFNSFTKKFFSGKRKSRICTLTELYLASCDERYNASMPYLSTLGENMLTDSGAVIYCSNGKSTCLTQNDFTVYRKYTDKFSKTSKGFDVTKGEKGLSVRFIGNKSETADFENLYMKYYSKNFDIFNIVYYAKSCFLTMDNYEKYLDAAPGLIFE